MKPIPKIVNPVFEETDEYGSFLYSPLAPGYAMTLAVAIRHILYSSIPGSGIVSVAVEGYDHKFCTVPGMTEDILGFIENLKQMRFKLGDTLVSTRISINLRDIVEKEKGISIDTQMNSSKLGYFTLTSKMLECPDGVEVLNDVDLCTCVIGSDLKCILSVKRGSGYVDYSTKEDVDENFIPVNNILNSVTSCSYEIDSNVRYREWNDYQSLTLKVRTDGSIKPSEAVKKASSILISILSSVSGIQGGSEFDENRDSIPASILDTYILDIETFSKSTGSCLSGLGIYTVRDLANRTEQSLLGISGIGNKKLRDIKDLLKSFGLSLRKNREA